MTGRKFLLTLKKTASDYGIFVAVIFIVWLCFVALNGMMFGPSSMHGALYIMGEYIEFQQMRILATSFGGLFATASAIYFIVAGAQTASDMRNLSQLGTKKSISLLISLSVNLLFVLLSALVTAIATPGMLFFSNFGTRLLVMLGLFLVCYGTTFLFNAITTYFRPLISLVVILALVMLPKPSFLGYGSIGHQYILAIIELAVGSLMFLGKYSMLKSENL